MTWLPDDPAVRAWLQLARSDLRVAAVAADLEPAEWHIVCFLAQQAGEKALKALLEASDQPIPRTHDLVLLAEHLNDTSILEHVLDDAIVLKDMGSCRATPTRNSWRRRKKAGWRWRPRGAWWIA